MKEKNNILIGLAMIVLMGLTLSGCKLDEGEWQKLRERPSSVEADRVSVELIKEKANIPQNAEILKISMYEGAPKLVYYHEAGVTSSEGYKDENIIKIFDKKGQAVKTDAVNKLRAPYFSEDKNNNINAYITKNNVVLIDERGSVEKEIPLINREKDENKLTVLKEHEEAYLSGNGEYFGKFYVKYWTEKKLDVNSGLNLDRALYKFSYFNRSGKLLWGISGDIDNPIMDSLIQIAENGERILIVGTNTKKQKEASYLDLYDQDGKQICRSYFDEITEIKLTKDGKRAIFTVNKFSKGKTTEKYFGLDLKDGQLAELNVTNWNELNSIISE